MSKCINCQKPADGFCSGRCRNQYRSGLDTDLCVHCQSQRTRKKDHYCSRRCQLLHQ